MFFGKIFKAELLAKIGAALFLAGLVVSWRKPVWQFTNSWYEYAIIWIYALDVAAVLFLITALILFFKNKEFKEIVLKISKRRELVFIYLFVLVAGVSVFFSASPLLSFGAWIRMAVYLLSGLIMAAGLRAKVFNLNFVMGGLLAGGAVQAALALRQFWTQSSLGLGWLGEPIFNAFTLGAARMATEGGVLIRGYGLMLHPNILGGWLVLSFWAGVWFFLKTRSLAGKILLAGFLFLNIFGLIATFSRSAWMALGISFLAVAVFNIGKINKKKIRVGIMILVIILLATVPFWKLVKERAGEVSIREPAVKERITYIEEQKELIEMSPWFGVGIGGSTFRAGEEGLFLKSFKDEPWLWQPVHNIYLLIIIETGLAGFLLLITGLGMIILNILKGRGRKEKYIFLAMIISILTVGFFDHYFWTMANGIALWWLITGLLIYNGYNMED